jgi:hypothetical protein
MNGFHEPHSDRGKNQQYHYQDDDNLRDTGKMENVYRPGKSIKINPAVKAEKNQKKNYHIQSHNCLTHFFEAKGK